MCEGARSRLTHATPAIVRARITKAAYLCTSRSVRGRSTELSLLLWASLCKSGVTSRPPSTPPEKRPSEAAGKQHAGDTHVPRCAACEARLPLEVHRDCVAGMLTRTYVWADLAKWWGARNRHSIYVPQTS